VLCRTLHEKGGAAILKTQQAVRRDSMPPSALLDNIRAANILSTYLASPQPDSEPQ
jgi:hypothetical protein